MRWPMFNVKSPDQAHWFGAAHYSACGLLHLHACSHETTSPGNRQPRTCGKLSFAHCEATMRVTRSRSCARRGGGKSGEHVDVLGNHKLLDILLSAAAGHYEEVHTFYCRHCVLPSAPFY